MVDAGVFFMKAFAERVARRGDGEVEWKVLVQFDQLVMQAPTERRKVQGGVVLALEQLAKWFWAGGWD
eukprot:6330159-Lingulodinium_polyedra.AAC.1